MVPRSVSKMLCFALLAGSLACGLMSVVGCQREPARTSDSDKGKPVLAVSVFPVADLAHRIAGDRWKVVTLLPAGYSPHDYAMQPAAAAAVHEARAVIAVSSSLDRWAIDGAKAASGKREITVLADVLNVSSGQEGTTTAPADPKDMHEDDDADSHGHHVDGDDPHFWLDPLLAQRIAEQITLVLTRQDPPGRTIYQENLASLKKDLAALDAEYQAALTKCRTKALVVFHPGYGYLVRRYGLEQVALMGAGGVTPARLEEVVNRVRQEQIRGVFREPQYESKWVGMLAERSGAKVLVLDPLGQANLAGYDSYLAMMRSNLAALKEGLSYGS